MTDAERARALSGATRECGCDCHTDPGPQRGCCEHLHRREDGRIWVLDPEPRPDGTYRARKACPGYGRTAQRYHDSACCDGSGWLSALLLPEEACPAVHSIEGNQCGEHLCDGSGVRRRPDTDLLISLLEEEGWRVGRGLGAGWFTCDPVSGWIIHPSDPSILVAACEALKVEVKE